MKRSNEVLLVGIANADSLLRITPFSTNIRPGLLRIIVLTVVASNKMLLYLAAVALRQRSTLVGSLPETAKTNIPFAEAVS